MNFGISNMEFRDIPILQLLPQRPPFVMVSHLLDYTATDTTCSLTIEADNLFVEDGKLTACGLIENIAQTCAARIGYLNKYILFQDINIGFIGAVRDFHVAQLPQVGDEIVTHIHVLQDVFDMTLATAEVKLEDKVIASAEIKIAQSKEKKRD